jgi:hypothetical protein
MQASFCETADSPFFSLQLFFYLSFGLFQLLAILPLLALPVFRFGFLLANPHDLAVIDRPSLFHTHNEIKDLQRAAHRAENARMREDEEARLLRAEQAVVGRNAAALAREDDSVWELRI